MSYGRDDVHRSNLREEALFKKSRKVLVSRASRNKIDDNNKVWKSIRIRINQ